MLYLTREGTKVTLSSVSIDKDFDAWEVNKIELIISPRIPGDEVSEKVEMNILTNVLRNAGCEIMEE